MVALRLIYFFIGISLKAASRRTQPNKEQAHQGQAARLTISVSVGNHFGQTPVEGQK